MFNYNDNKNNKKYTYDDLLKLKEDKWGYNNYHILELFSDEELDKMMVQYFGENWKGDNVIKDESEK